MRSHGFQLFYGGGLCWGFDAAIRLTNSQKAEFIVHPDTGGTSPGQKRGWKVYDFVTQGNGLSTFLYPSPMPLRYIVNALHYGILLQEIALLSFKAFHFIYLRREEEGNYLSLETPSFRINIDINIFREQSVVSF